MKKIIRENAVGITQNNGATEKSESFREKRCNRLDATKKCFFLHDLLRCHSVAPLLRVSNGIFRLIRSVSVCVLLSFMGAGLLSAAEKWPGVDEAVVKKIAREHGRDERPSLFPAAEGDLQLFMFLMAGAAGGFVAGYYWRVLLEGKKGRGKKL
jgi:hypothetical protein